MRYFKMIAVMAVFASLASSSFAVEEADNSPTQYITDWAATFNKNDPNVLHRIDGILAYYTQRLNNVRIGVYVALVTEFTGGKSTKI